MFEIIVQIERMYDEHEICVIGVTRASSRACRKVHEMFSILAYCMFVDNEEPKRKFWNFLAYLCT